MERKTHGGHELVGSRHELVGSNTLGGDGSDSDILGKDVPADMKNTGYYHSLAYIKQQHRRILHGGVKGLLDMYNKAPFAIDKMRIDLEIDQLLSTLILYKICKCGVMLSESSKIMKGTDWASKKCDYCDKGVCIYCKPSNGCGHTLAICDECCEDARHILLCASTLKRHRIKLRMMCFVNDFNYVQCEACDIFIIPASDNVLNMCVGCYKLIRAMRLPCVELILNFVLETAASYYPRWELNDDYHDACDGYEIAKEKLRICRSKMGHFLPPRKISKKSSVEN